MKAIVVSQLNNVEVRDDVRPVEVGPTQVKVKMRASGVCRTDLSAATGIWPTRLPAILGHEGAGEIIEVGSDVHDMVVGDRVILANLRGCGHCFHCVRSEPFLCGHEDQKGAADHNFLVSGKPAFGMVGLGAWAEEVVLPSTSLVPFVGDDVPWEIASLINCAVMTGVGAVISTAQVNPGSTVVIIGAGGVGAAAVMGARLAGASTIAVIDPIESKFAKMKSFGATHTATPDEYADIKEELTGRRGFDYAFEFVGRDNTIRAAWDAVRIGGTVILAGIGSETTSSPLTLYEMTMDGKSVRGSVGGSVVPLRDYQIYLDLWRRGQLPLEGLVTETIRLEGAPDALNALATGKDVLRQVILFE